MAKAKGPASVQNRHIYTRVSYLYQAANYLAERAQAGNERSSCTFLQQQQQEADNSTHSAPSLDKSVEREALMNVSRHIIADMRSVSLKTQIRLSPTIKTTVCKFCDTVQIEGRTCQSSVENPSKGGRKPWADVLVVRCGTCGHAKRYPISATRQKRRSMRVTEAAEDGASREDDTSASKTDNVT